MSSFEIFKIDWQTEASRDKQTNMGDFPQPQQKIAGNGENCHIVVAVNFYSVNQTF